ELFRLRGHDRAVVAAAFSPDGRFLATGDWFGGVKVWDATTPPEVTRLTEEATQLHDLAFSPDGRELATAHEAGARLRRWAVRTGRRGVALRGHEGSGTEVAVSVDGKTLATAGGADDKTMRLWDPVRGEQWGWAAVPAGVNRLATSPAGRLLAAACPDNVVLL